ncbi:glycoside hydrolase family 79 protein [Mycena albidolilacea]|uniref:Glycoside hydrolase family 79 protein n=1 Tax=Mycena albidolilacea TaxID=1033008 RepID=A0AAD7APG2_9AGAR|nr:glycoside hydrolase family 79 protein [Mycena albidolilacea]
MFLRHTIPIFYLVLGIYAANAPTTLTLHGPASLPFNASYPLHPSLASFSIETAFFIEYLGNRTAPNTLTSNLLQNLKDRTGTPAEVRIGGITADSTYWDASLDTALSNFIVNGTVLVNTTIGPEFWEAAKTLLPEDTKITMNLDLHDFKYAGALSVAQSAVDGLSPGQLVALEIGNEPDHYSPLLSAQAYDTVWELWSKNISDALGFRTPIFQIAATAEDPLWPYDAPGASSALDCVSALAAGANNAGTVKLCSEHTYQYSVCDAPRIPIATLPNLVNHTRLAVYLDLWQPRIQSVRAQLGPDSFVIGEYNSVSCSGKAGVSDTFGQALWLLDTTFYAASLNVSRLYIHQGGPLALQSSTQLNHGGLSRYDLWYPVDALNGEKQVFPSYSAYLFITETIGHSKNLRIANLWPGRQSNGSTITTAGGDISAGQSVVYGFWEDSAQEFPSKIALLNLQIFNQTEAGPRPTTTFDISAFLPPRHKSVTVKRLQAPGADVTFGNLTTWAGQTFALDSNGLAKGQYKEDNIAGGKIVVEASGAALVSL